MYYSLDEAKAKVIEAGHKLLEEGLVARTWGNISARIAKEEFVITPSGRGYEDLKPEDLVIIKVADASYEGNIKPSSEKILHAACYRNREDCGFIIHTHQLYASAISVAAKDFEFAPCAAYGLPGTEKLANAVETAVKKNPSANAFLMERHGAVMLGESFEDAFSLSSDLEMKSKDAFLQALDIEEPKDSSSYFEIAGKHTEKIKAYIDDFAQLIGLCADSKKSIAEICTGADAWAEEQILIKNCAAYLYANKVGAKPLGFFDSYLQRQVYLKKYSKLKDSNK